MPVTAGAAGSRVSTLTLSGAELPDVLPAGSTAETVKVCGPSASVLSALMPQITPGAILNDLAHLPNVFRLYRPLANAHSFAPQEPAEGDAPRDQRDPSAYRKGNAAASATDVARQLHPVVDASPQANAAVVEPLQAPAPIAAPPAPTEVPVTWRVSDARSASPPDAQTATIAEADEPRP